jgi:hypothetical protein
MPQIAIDVGSVGSSKRTPLWRRARSGRGRERVVRLVVGDVVLRFALRHGGEKHQKSDARNASRDHDERCGRGRHRPQSGAVRNPIASPGCATLEITSAPLWRAAATSLATFGTELAQRQRRCGVQVCVVKSMTRSAVSFGASVTGASAGGGASSLSKRQ